MVAQFVLDVLRCDRNDVRVLNGCQLDEVVHDFIADDERRIAVGVVLAIRGVVIVIAQQRAWLGWDHVLVVENCIDLILWRVDENEGRDKRLGDNVLLAMLRNLLITHRGITFYVAVINNLLCFFYSAVWHSHYKPLLTMFMDILYRHPILVFLDGGSAGCNFSTVTLWAGVSRLPILQWSVSLDRLRILFFHCYRQRLCFLRATFSL